MYPFLTETSALEVKHCDSKNQLTIDKHIILSKKDQQCDANKKVLQNEKVIDTITITFCLIFMS